MKAVVLEIKDGYAAVLTEDGQFKKITDDGYAPGMELTLESKRERKAPGRIIAFRSRRFLQTAAAAAAALLIFAGIKDFNTPYGIISLDVNPSIEISINRYDRVLDIEAVNDDGTELADELNSCGLKYKSIDEAVDMALSSLSEGDYAAEDGTTYVMISANSESSAHSDRIADELGNLCNEHEAFSAMAVSADDALLERARQNGTTAGKLYLVDSLRDARGGDDFDEEEWLKKPVRDIMYEITGKENSEPSQTAPDEPADGSDANDPPSFELPENDTEAPQPAPPENDDEKPEPVPSENDGENPQPEPPENEGENPQPEPNLNDPDGPQTSPVDGGGKPDSDAPGIPPEQDGTEEAAPADKPDDRGGDGPAPGQLNSDEPDAPHGNDAPTPPEGGGQPQADSQPRDGGSDRNPPK